MEKTAEAIVKKYFPYITKPSSIKRAVKAMEQYASQFKQPEQLPAVNVPQHTNSNIEIKESLLKGSEFNGREAKEYSHETVLNVMEEYASQFKQPSEWISVEDRLPNHDADILFYDFGYNERKIHQGIFVTKDLFHRANMFISSEGGYFDLSHVTHWQPLPTQPSK